MSQWYAVQTNPRCEARAAASIMFPTYLPRRRQVRIHHRTKAEIEREYALLTGYLFVALPSPGHVGFVRGCDGVKRVLEVQGAPLPIPASIVERLHDQEFRGHYDDVWVRRKSVLDAIKPVYRKDDMVEVVRGVFAGKNGVIARMINPNRAIVEVEGLCGLLAQLQVPIDELAIAA